MALIQSHVSSLSIYHSCWTYNHGVSIGCTTLSSIPDGHCLQCITYLLPALLYAGGSLHALAGCDGDLVLCTYKYNVCDRYKAAISSMGPSPPHILQRWNSAIVYVLLIMFKPAHSLVRIMSILAAMVVYFPQEHKGCLASKAACTVCRGCS